MLELSECWWKNVENLFKKYNFQHKDELHKELDVNSAKSKTTQLWIDSGVYSGAGAQQARAPLKFDECKILEQQVFVPKSPSECSYNAPFVIDISKIFLGEHAPRPP